MLICTVYTLLEDSRSRVLYINITLYRGDRRSRVLYINITLYRGDRRSRVLYINITLYRGDRRSHVLYINITLYRGDRRSRVLDVNLIPSQNIPLLTPSQASIAETNWKFVNQLLKVNKQVLRQGRLDYTPCVSHSQLQF